MTFPYNEWPCALTFLSTPSGCGFKGHAVHIIILHTISVPCAFRMSERRRRRANSIAGEAILGYTRAFLVLFSLSVSRIYKYIKKFLQPIRTARASTIIFLSRRRSIALKSWVIGGTYACVTYCQVLVSPAHVCHLIANTILHWSCDDELHFGEKVKGDDVRYALWFFTHRILMVSASVPGLAERKCHIIS